jgi:hypothetical protein
MRYTIYNHDSLSSNWMPSTMLSHAQGRMYNHTASSHFPRSYNGEKDEY